MFCGCAGRLSLVLRRWWSDVLLITPLYILQTCLMNAGHPRAMKHPVLLCMRTQRAGVKLT